MMKDGDTFLLMLIMHIFLTVVRFLTNISFPFVKQIKVDLWKTSSIFFLPYISRTWKILDWWNKLMLGFSENPCHLWELSIPARCLWLAESFNLWVERMALTGGLRSLSGFAGEIVNSIGQRNLRSSGKVKEFLKPMTVATIMEGGVLASTGLLLCFSLVLQCR